MKHVLQKITDYYGLFFALSVIPLLIERVSKIYAMSRCTGSVSFLGLFPVCKMETLTVTESKETRLSSVFDSYCCENFQGAWNPATLDRAEKRDTTSLACGRKCGLERARPKNAIRNMELSLKPKHIFVIGDIFSFIAFSRKVVVVVV